MGDQVPGACSLLLWGNAAGFRVKVLVMVCLSIRGITEGQGVS